MDRFEAEKVIISDNQPKSLRELSRSEIQDVFDGKGKDRNPQEVQGMEYGCCTEVFS